LYYVTSVLTYRMFRIIYKFIVLLHLNTSGVLRLRVTFLFVKLLATHKYFRFFYVMVQWKSVNMCFYHRH
jgi:hypothetical protein